MLGSWIRVTAVLVVGGALLAGDARADWPMARHDARRTGVADGTSDISTPGAYWRTYLGGRLGLGHVMPLNLEEPAVAYVSAGRVFVARADGVPVWSSDNQTIVTLVAAADLDGDGAGELIARSQAQVFVFDATTGALRWVEDEGEMGTIGAVLATDVDGDAIADLVIEECSCCRVSSNVPGFVYTFAGGFTSARRAWALPFAFCGGARSLLVDDVDGDGDQDVLLGGWSSFTLLDGATGTAVAASPNLGTWVGLSWCQAADLDDMAGKEVVCVHGTELETAGAGHRVFALRRDGASLAVAWSRNVGDRDEAIGIPADFLHDLDGDGTLEVTVTGTLASGQKQTVILDAHTGELLATLTGEVAVGTAQVGTSAIVVTHAEHDLSTWTFDRDAASPLTLRWEVDDRRELYARDWELAARRPISHRLIVADVDADGGLDLFTINTKKPWEVPVHALTSATGATEGVFEARPDSEVLAGWGPAGGAVTLSSSDGRLHTITTQLAPVGQLRTGGYYAPGGWGDLPWGPVAADLVDDDDDEVVIADSRRTLLALDARGATNASPPSIVWSRAQTTAPSIVPGLGLGGETGLACRHLDLDMVPPLEMVTVLDRTGAERWSMPIGAQVFNDLLAGNLDGDAVPDIVVQWGEPNDTAVRTTALAGTDGHALWTTVTTAGQTRFPAGAALTDWNGDDVDDVVFHHYGTRVLSGVDGAEIALGGPTGYHYFMPTLVDVVGDDHVEVSLHGGFYPNSTLTSDLSAAVWTDTEDDRPYPYASVATCASGPVLINGSLAHASRLKVTLQAGGTPGAWQSVVLAGGAVYPDEAAATTAGASITNQLTSIHLHADLTGLGHASAVVGSTDGWLYAVDPCTLTLDFALQFGVPVGAVAFADTDDDGKDEILVSTADGYLHGVRQQPIAPPDEVRDVDLALGNDVDIDEVTTRGTLSAAWEPIAGADGYEVSVARDEGGIVSEPAWLRVDATFVTFADLPLENGVRYVVGVRAVSAAGPSPDTLSDGVLVHLEASPVSDAGASAWPDAGNPAAPQPGCCRVGGGGPGGAVALAFVVLVVITGRRGRRP